MSEPLTEGYKWCPRCKRNQRITRFPMDRSRRDGRWHSCKTCAKDYWNKRGKDLRTARAEKKRRERQQLQGLKGLSRYSHQNT